jgi:DNA gyrase subunit A
MLRFRIDDEQLPVLSRTAQGQPALRLGKQERLVGCIAQAPDEYCVLLTAQGFAKQMSGTALRLAQRGELGMQAIQFVNKTDTLAGIIPAFSGAELTVMTNTDRIAKVAIDDIPEEGKDGGGERLLKPGKGEKITHLTIPLLNEAESEEEELDSSED